MAKDFFKISDLIFPFVKNLRLVIIIVILITITSLVISLILPKTYLSRAEVIQTNQSVGSFGGILQSIGSFNSGQRKVGGETILVILNSQSLKDSLINNFDLFNRYEEDYKESLYRKLSERIQIEEMREGGLGFNPIVSVKIGVIDETPQFAQQLNEYIIDFLSNRMENINNENSKYSLELIKERFQKNQLELEQAEKALNDFQNTYGIFEIETQLSVLIESIAIVKQEIIEKEIQLELIRLNFGENSSQYRSITSELSALETKYQGLIEKSNTQEQIQFASPNLKDVPDLFLTYARLFREVEIQNTIYEFIVPQLEQQELYLLNSNSGLRIIDKPDLPTYKYKPKRAYIVIAGFIFSLVIACLLVLYIESSRREDSEINRLKEIFRKT